MLQINSCLMAIFEKKEMFLRLKKYSIPLSVFVLTAFILTFVQLKVDTKMLALDRFMPFGGWIEIILISAYSFFVANKMKDPSQSARWRKITWSIFTIAFFSQLLLGIFVNSDFLLSGKLHIPVPVIIVSGPIYRGHMGFMTILLLSTILLTGPAWCSQLCYFGAIDNLFAGKKVKSKKKMEGLFQLKHSLLLLVIVGTIALRIFRVDIKIATVLGIGFGVLGIIIMALFSRKTGTMKHCIAYCPIGTVVNYLKFVSPFRMKINSACHMCMACTSSCKYNALSPVDLANKKVGLTCTNCGDCVTSCSDGFISYKFLNLSTEKSRNLYLILTVSLHAIFLALGRI